MGKAGCLQCCAGFSAIGMVFLTIMAILLASQPEYIHGYHHKTKPQAKNSCMYAAVLYGLTFAGATYLLRKHKEEESMRYGVVSTKDEAELLKNDDNDSDLPVKTSVLSTLKSQLMNAKVMHSEEMASLVKGDSAASPRSKKSKPRKGD
ncbi:hypothetical protein ACHHYP_12268 [Achlya hypogyna]|uniref:Transmembrane protein n=1 Tax=Achlya hypogyna TaxID=1202772 RepID=A0A1V9YHE6_ACHHY|nr:hypothetical protein ACHHYP_12268 [Achlya hypogyna]